MAMKERAPRRTPSQSAESETRDAGPDTFDAAVEFDVSISEDGSASASAPVGEEDALVDDSDAGIESFTEQEYRGWFSSIKKAATGIVKKVSGAVKDNAKDILKAGLPFAGSAIGGFFGGPAGAAIGGKAGSIAGGVVREVPETVEQARERALRTIDELETQAAQLDAIADQVLDQTLPVVIDEIARDFAERGARGEGGPADDEVMERFWGKAFGKIAGAIADELPWAIKKVTQYLSDSGSRDTETIDPLMLDPEVAQRFWAPAFSTIVSSIQSMLPDAFQLIAGQSRAFRPGSGEIDWQQLETIGRLPGGDDIAVTGLTAIEDPTMVEIGLTLPEHKSWKKAIEVRGADDTVLASVEVEGSTKSSTMRIGVDAIKEARLVFAKADGLYTLPAKSIPDLAGQRVDFYWYAG
ncbi:hypothetical protein [Agromyces binzhouensis]|uniref:hypothetical protein n=1 Tax=Agromyces binzhouensis TaxID=1817495 RepID=UPI0036439A13